MCRNLIINTSISILVTTEELVFIYHLIDFNRHDYLNAMETVRRNRATNQGK